MAKTKSTYEIENLIFTYPEKSAPALRGISLEIKRGEMVVICGQSGSGKSTLLKNLKPVIAPHGSLSGSIRFNGKYLGELSLEEQAVGIGFVFQNPEAQIITDKVWHELAFGLESLGLDTKTIRLRVAEMASYFGIQSWFHRDVNTLSGGQKQLLNLASVMAMQPEVLILDEPTSQLDPIAAGEFLDTVAKINRELGTTVLLTEHRLEEVLPMADRAVVLDKGQVLADGTPQEVGRILAMKNHPMFRGMPTPVQVYSSLYASGVGCDTECPVNVRDGRKWLTEIMDGTEINIPALPADDEAVPLDSAGKAAKPVLEFKDVWFRYSKDGEDVIRDLSLKAYPGEMFCIVGGNGTGKTTALTLAAGINKPYRGKIKTTAKSTAVLPQNPQTIFVENSVLEDLAEMTGDIASEKLHEIAKLVEIEELLDMHPYDLSGGEQQRAALAKVLLAEPEILFLDEPTKGIDNGFKTKLADILKKLQQRGVTIVIVSHDVEFCGRYGDRCGMFFDGKIITTNVPRTFFSGNSFYTTAANRMSRHLFENAVTAEDVVELVKVNMNGQNPHDPGDDGKCEQDDETSIGDVTSGDENTGGGEIVNKRWSRNSKAFDRLLDAGALIATVVTIYLGFFAFDNKHYMAVCLLMILYAMVPVFVKFEKSRPQARELMIIAVLVATAVVGRAAFYAIPNFKPILAIVIISGVALGKRCGFLVGAMSAFVSNFLFGQGPWTPWQMIAMAVIGYLAGAIFSKYYDEKEDAKALPLVVFGTVSVFFLYGAIVDIWTILSVTPEPTMATIISVYGAAFYFNLIHCGATALFLAILTKPILTKLKRIKIKYGMYQYA